MRAPDPLLAGMYELARQLATRDTEPTLLSCRADTPVVEVADVVVKAHPIGADPESLARRLAVAGDRALASLLLSPLRLPGGGFVTEVRDRLVTGWPAGVPVDPDDPDAAPWEEAGRLLARLHAVPAQRSGRLPPGGAPTRVARAIDRLAAAAGHPAAETVRTALATLPEWATGAVPPPPGRPRTVVHGDWHLGQLVRMSYGWRLVDVDDLGYGDPAWDLARPASWYATGMLPLDAWARLLDAYRGAGGVAVPRTGDPWPALDVPAKALTVQGAALAVARASRQVRELTEDEALLVDACGRIAAPVSR